MESSLVSALADRYRIEREIGAGGMATVYLARDIRHERLVAVKVVRPELAAALGPSRFLAEIRMTARLQHPHIMALLDSGAVDGVLFFVMPYVEGESLRDRLTREKLLPLADALRIASEVAGALDYAHRHGVIHRDIKPENILLHDGQALVADFGIALAVQTAGGDRLTQTGLSLGTPSYMSPEQALGEKVIDARTDVYSLGAVLYEMLTGDPPFTGNTVQAVVAKVMTERPASVSLLRDTVPQEVATAVHTALAKLPADRFASAAEFAAAFATPARHGTVGSREAPVTTTRSTIGGWSRGTIALASVTGLAIAAALWGWLRPRPPATAVGQVRVAIPAPAHYEIVDGFPALSPDGRSVVFAADSAGITRLYLRDLDEFEAQAIPGTEGVGADRPVSFAPDGDWILFMVANRLFKTKLRSTEPPRPIPGIPTSPSLFFAGASWGEDGSIVFVQDLAKGLMRISAAGGTPEVVTTTNPAEGEFVHAWPEWIPGSKTVLFAILGKQGWRVVARSLVDGRQVTVVPGALMARFVEPGYLVYSKDGVLNAVRFDRKILRTIGEPLAVGDNLPSLSWLASSTVYFGVSRNGDLSYLVGNQTPSTRLELVDRQGNVRQLKEAAGTRPRFAPNGTSIIAEERSQIWQYDLTRGGTRTRLTSGGLRYVPVVSPDGSQLVLSSYDTGPAELYLLSTTAAGTSKRLVPGTTRRYAASWTANGNRIAYHERDATTGADIWVVAAADGATPEPVVKTEFDEYHPRFSPDGRWLAFASRRSGRAEVYVQTYPLVGGPQRVSTDGGEEPVWDASGRALYYRNGSRIMSCSVGPGTTPKVGEPRQLLEIENLLAPNDIAFAYDVSPDGQWFVVTTTTPKPPRELRLVVNWIAGTPLGPAR